MDSLLKFEIDDFRTKCYDIYKGLMDTIEPKIKEQNEKLLNAMILETKNNISKTICGKDLYDYSEIEKFNYDDLMKIYSIGQTEYFNCEPKFVKQTKFHILVDEEPRDRVVNIDNIKLINNEFIFLHFSISDCSRNTSCYVFITNYSQMVCFDVKHDTLRESRLIISKLNFWLPTDYINIFKLIFSKKSTDESSDIRKTGLHSFHEIQELLIYIRDILYNRKFIPLYAKEILDENIKLKKEHEKFKKEKEEFTTYKQDYETRIEPYRDLMLREKDLLERENKLKQEKEKLRLVSIKLSMEKKQLEKDKLKFKEINVDETLK